jgi:hypothetical protein
VTGLAVLVEGYLLVAPITMEVVGFWVALLIGYAVAPEGYLRLKAF